MNEFYIAFGVIFVLGTLFLLRSKNEKFLGLFFMVRTRHFLSFIDWIAKLAPGLWKFLADLAVVFSFGGLGAAYLSNQRKDSKSLGKILFLAGSFVLLAWAGLFFWRGGLVGIVTLLLSFLALASFIKYLSKLKNTSLDYVFSTVVLSLAFIKFIEGITLILGSDLKVPLYISAIEGAFGIPPLLIGMFMMQAFQILFAGSNMPGVAPMLPSVNPEGEIGVGVPGYDIFVPIVYALIAFTVLLFSHEFAHGVLARVHKIKLKSTGLLTFGIIPVGAFVEPDEKELEGRSSIQKMHVFAAGSFANVLVCAASIVVMFSLSAFLVSSDGVLVSGLTGNSSAKGIIEKGDVIYSVNNVTLNSSAGYKKTVSGYAPGSVLSLGTSRGTFDVTAGESPENASVAYLGMYTENNIMGKYGLDMGILNFVWTTLTWMIFFNMNVALVNLLPIAPFDGWRMLREVMYVFKISELHAKKIVYAIVAFCLILLLINALPLVGMFLDYANSLFAI
jgi:membrane-associated protease RseP (regulator of RpoE activity)